MNSNRAQSIEKKINRNKTTAAQDERNGVRSSLRKRQSSRRKKKVSITDLRPKEISSVSKVSLNINHSANNNNHSANSLRKSRTIKLKSSSRSGVSPLHSSSRFSGRSQRRRIAIRSIIKKRKRKKVPKIQIFQDRLKSAICDFSIKIRSNQWYCYDSKS